MGKAINSRVCWERMHDQARKAYLADDKKHDWFQIMLNLELNCFRASRGGTIKSYMSLHDILLDRRKRATELKYSR